MKYKTESQIKKIADLYDEKNPSESWIGKWICYGCGEITTSPAYVTSQSGLPLPEALCMECLLKINRDGDTI